MWIEPLDELFCEAAGLPPGERVSFLERSCGDNAALRAEVESLLSAHERAGNFMTSPLELPDAVQSASATDTGISPGERIGTYQIVRLIASGGMANVYEAIQDRPRRSVALKLLRAELSSPSALRRFQYEAELLGSLSHPGIARIYEAGLCDLHGMHIPFFAMEYLPEARSIDQYCTEKGLGIRERLSLFVSVCHTVHFGHQRGVIHRDLKPSNLMVDVHETPRVIDFGVARVTGGPAAAATPLTHDAGLIGTLAYMSPEQCDTVSADLDARTDVYSLGVVLYLLLCGRSPYELAGLSILASARVVRDQVPDRPSRVNPRLDSDLDIILLKALEKDRQQRYQSASELAADLQRYLAHEPIAARPPSFSYHLLKLARRHRSIAAGAVLAMAGLLLGTALATWLAVEATVERNHAAAARKLANQQAAQALREADAANRVSSCLGRVLNAVVPSNSSEMDAGDSSLGILNETMKAVTEELKIQSAYQAVALIRIGDAYRRLQRPDLAIDVLEQAVAACQAGAPEYAAQAACHLAAARCEACEPRTSEILLQNVIGVLETSGHDPPLLGEAFQRLGDALSVQGRHVDALAAYRKGLSLRRQTRGVDNPLYGSVLLRMASAMSALHDVQGLKLLRPEAESLQTLSLTLPEKDPHRSGSLLLLGMIDLGMGDAPSAESSLRQAVELRNRALGPHHWMTAYAENVLGECLAAQGRDSEGESLLIGTISPIRSAVGPGNINIFEATRRTMKYFEDRGRSREADRFRAIIECADGS